METLNQRIVRQVNAGQDYFLTVYDFPISIREYTGTGTGGQSIKKLPVIYPASDDKWRTPGPPIPDVGNSAIVKFGSDLIEIDAANVGEVPIFSLVDAI